MRIWHSESDPTTYDITQDTFYVPLDDANGLLRLADYAANGSHMTTVLFVGPDADRNAQKFDAAVKAEEEAEDGLDPNCDMKELIKKCFSLD